MTTGNKLADAAIEKNQAELNAAIENIKKRYAGNQSDAFIQSEIAGRSSKMHLNNAQNTYLALIEPPVPLTAEQAEAYKIVTLHELKQSGHLLFALDEKNVGNEGNPLRNNVMVDHYVEPGEREGRIAYRISEAVDKAHRTEALSALVSPSNHPTLKLTGSTPEGKSMDTKPSNVQGGNPKELNTPTPTPKPRAL